VNMISTLRNFRGGPVQANLGGLDWPPWGGQSRDKFLGGPIIKKNTLYKAENLDVIVWWAYTIQVEGTLLSSLIFHDKTPIWLPGHRLDSRTRLACCSKQDPEGEATDCANLPSCKISLLLSLVSKLLEIHPSP